MKIFPAYSVSTIDKVDPGSLVMTEFSLGVFWCLRCKWEGVEAEAERAVVVVLGPKLPRLKVAQKEPGCPFWREVELQCRVLSVGKDFFVDLPTSGENVQWGSPGHLEHHGGIFLVGDQAYLRLPPRDIQDDPRVVRLDTGEITFELPKSPRAYFRQWTFSIPGNPPESDRLRLVSYPDGI